MRLTPKAMAVLRVLAEQPGQVVSREQLLAEVWPDTLPTNDVVTQAITQLRKALAHAGDVAGRSGCIETIAKTGYRLLSPVAWEPAPEEPAATLAHAAGTARAQPSPAEPEAVRGPALPPPVSPQAVPARRMPNWMLASLLALALLCGAAGGLLWFARGAASGALQAEEGGERVLGMPRLPYRLITSGGGFDLTPTLSPDGSMVAYASRAPERLGTSILIKTTNNSPPRHLGQPGADESDRSPTWSPDGREIAFSRHGEDGSCKVMVVAANGAADEREVARCDFADLPSFSWVPGRHALLFGSMTAGSAGGGIRELDLDTGKWRDLAYDNHASELDYLPRYSPDGRWIVFVRNPQMGDLWRVPASGGKAEPLTRESAEIRGWDWLPDSSGLVFGRRVDSQSRLYRLDLSTRRLHDLGVADAESPAISADKGRLAFTQRRPKFVLYRIHHDGGGGYRRQRLFASNGRDAQPMVSPDGRQMVFTSDRSGEYAMWWGDLSRPDSAHPIEGLLPETRQPPDWSPDSRSLLAIGRDREGRPLLYEASPSEGRATVLPVPAPRPLQGLHAGDPSRILVLAGEEDGGASLLLYDRSRKPWQELARLEDVSQARFDARRGEVYFTRLSDGGLWRIDAALSPGSQRQIDAEAPSRWRYRSWALTGRGQAYYLYSTPDCSTFGAPVGEGPADAGACVDAAQFSATNGFSIAGADGAMYVAMATADGAGIGYMELPEPAGSIFAVLPKLLSVLVKPSS